MIYSYAIILKNAMRGVDVVCITRGRQLSTSRQYASTLSGPTIQFVNRQGASRLLRNCAGKFEMNR